MIVDKEASVIAVIRDEAGQIAPHLDVGDIDRDTEIADIGMDSLELLALVTRLERRLHISLMDRNLYQVTTVGDLVALMVGTAPDGGPARGTESVGGTGAAAAAGIVRQVVAPDYEMSR